MRNITITTAIAIVALGLTSAWSYHFGTEAERTEFIPTKWKERASVYAYSNDPGCVRGDMALDIVATDILIGKTVTETKSLLGEPNKSNADALHYELGQCSGFGWYESELVVILSKSQLVSKAKITRATPKDGLKKPRLEKSAPVTTWLTGLLILKRRAFSEFP